MADQAIRLFITLLVTLILGVPQPNLAGDSASPSWLQWGGPNRDFHAPAGKLALNWPEAGPETLWSRPIGEGHSAVLYEEGRLYTMHRAGENEAVICLDAVTGQTLWEVAYEAEYEGLRQYGIGPRSTPLIVDDRLFSVGVAGRMHALDKITGRILWSQELWGEEFAGSRLGHGASGSANHRQARACEPDRLAWRQAVYRDTWCRPIR